MPDDPSYEPATNGTMLDRMTLRYEGPDIRQAISLAKTLRRRLCFAVQGEDGLPRTPRWEASLRRLITFEFGQWLDVQEIDGSLEISLVPFRGSGFAYPRTIRFTGGFDDPRTRTPDAVRSLLDELVASLERLAAVTGHDDGVSRNVEAAKRLAALDTADPTTMKCIFLHRRMTPITPAGGVLDVRLPYPTETRLHHSDDAFLTSEIQNALNRIPETGTISHVKHPSRMLRHETLQILPVIARVEEPKDPLERMRIIAERTAFASSPRTEA